MLDPDQADDLRELIGHTAILQEWIEHAANGILDNLADFAYQHTVHPCSYIHWLTEDLATTSAPLRAATNSSCDTLDTSVPVGNPNPAPGTNEVPGEGLA